MGLTGDLNYLNITVTKFYCFHQEKIIKSSPLKDPSYNLIISNIPQDNSLKSSNYVNLLVNDYFVDPVDKNTFVVTYAEFSEILKMYENNWYTKENIICYLKK